jgi:hypothetical protein
MAGHPALDQPRKNWFQRHLGLVIAGGCGAALACLALLVFLVFVLVFALVRNSDATTLALERARSNAVVVEHIGRPLEPGWMIWGNLNADSVSGHAELEIPIHGNKGKGTIYLVADKRAWRWSFSTLDVAFADGTPRIDLLQPTPEPAR